LIVGCLVSCETKTPEQLALEAQQKKYEDQKKAQEAELKKWVDNTPDLYRVNWKVCNDGAIIFSSDINKGCNETRNPPTKGFKEPAIVWGPVVEAKFFSKPDHLATGYIRTALFVKSQGCLIKGNPQKVEQFYKVADFWLKRGDNPQPSTDVKIEKISAQEKPTVLKQALVNAQTENYSLKTFGTSTNGLIPTTSQEPCMTYDQWRNTPS